MIDETGCDDAGTFHATLDVVCGHFGDVFKILYFGLFSEGPFLHHAVQCVGYLITSGIGEEDENGLTKISTSNMTTIVQYGRDRLENTSWHLFNFIKYEN